MKRKICISAFFVVSLLFCSLVIWEKPLKQVSVIPSGDITIVVDAGHGGVDGGATAADGTLEKDITLQIAEEFEKILEEYPVNVIMTRSVDTGLYDGTEQTIRSKKRKDLQRRREIFNEEGVDLAVSIHLNSFPQDESVYGAQVFYPAQTKGRTNGQIGEHTAAGYAKNVQKSLEINISDGRERQAMEKNDILIFEDINCPVILIECGFMSNEKELNRLKTAEYQRVLAKAIWEGINENLCLKKQEKIEVVDSANRF